MAEKEEIKLDNETVLCVLLGEMIRVVRKTKSIETVLEYASRIHKMYTEDKWISDEKIEELAMKHYPVFERMRDDWRAKNAFEQAGFITGYKEAQRKILGDILPDDTNA